MLPSNILEQFVKSAYFLTLLLKKPDILLIILPNLKCLTVHSHIYPLDRHRWVFRKSGRTSVQSKDTFRFLLVTEKVLPFRRFTDFDKEYTVLLGQRVGFSDRQINLLGDVLQKLVIIHKEGLAVRKWSLKLRAPPPPPPLPQPQPKKRKGGRKTIIIEPRERDFEALVITDFQNALGWSLETITSPDFVPQDTAGQLLDLENLRDAVHDLLPTNLSQQEPLWFAFDDLDSRVKKLSQHLNLLTLRTIYNHFIFMKEGELLAFWDGVFEVKGVDATDATYGMKYQFTLPPVNELSYWQDRLDKLRHHKELCFWGERYDYHRWTSLNPKVLNRDHFDARRNNYGSFGEACMDHLKFLRNSRSHLSDTTTSSDFLNGLRYIYPRATAIYFNMIWNVININKDEDFGVAAPFTVAFKYGLFMP